MNEIDIDTTKIIFALINGFVCFRMVDGRQRILRKLAVMAWCLSAFMHLLDLDAMAVVPEVIGMMALVVAMVSAFQWRKRTRLP